jgi:hypothetical protein
VAKAVSETAQDDPFFRYYQAFLVFAAVGFWNFLTSYINTRQAERNRLQKEAAKTKAQSEGREEYEADTEHNLELVCLRVGFDLERYETYCDTLGSLYGIAVEQWRKNVVLQKQAGINTEGLEFALSQIDALLKARPRPKHVTESRQAVLLRTSLEKKYPQLNEIIRLLHDLPERELSEENQQG